MSVADVRAGLHRSNIDTSEESRHYEGWRVAAASGVGVFVSFASLLVYTFGVFLKPFADEFSWSREAVSSAFGFAAMAAAVTSPLLGRLFDRFPPRRIIVSSLVIFGGGFASLALLTPHLWHLYIVFAMLGMVANGTAQMAYSRAISSWFERRRGFALAVMMSGGALGAMVLPPVAELLIRRVGWRQACLTLGIGALVIGLPPVIGFVRERPSPADPRERHVPGSSVRDGLTSRVFWILAGVLFCSSIAQNGAITQLSAILTDRGVTARGGALALSAMGGSALAGRLATGWLLDRFFAPRVSFALLAITALGAAILAEAHTLSSGVAAAILIGVGMGGEGDVTPYLLSRYFGLRSFATLYGLTWTFYAAAGAIGPILMGRVFDATGSYEGFLLNLALATLVVASFMLLLPRYEASVSLPVSQPAPEVASIARSGQHS